MRILVINLAAIGDVVLSSVVAKELKKKYPGSRVDYLVQPLCAPVIELSPFVNGVYVYDKKNRDKGILRYCKLVNSLRKMNYDMSVSVNFAVRGAILAFFIHAKLRLGYGRKVNGLFYTHRESGDRKEIKKEGLNQLEILKPLGIITKDANPSLKAKESDLKTIRKLLGKKGNIKRLVFCPASSENFKNLPIELSAEVIEKLSSEFDVFAVGSVTEICYFENLASSVKGKVRIFPGTLTLGELAALISFSDVLLSIDTGPLHMAQALNVPATALFGPTDPRVWGPHGERNEVITAELECSPCSFNRECSENKCMRNLDVMKICRSVLKMAEKS